MANEQNANVNTNVNTNVKTLVEEYPLRDLRTLRETVCRNKLLQYSGKAVRIPERILDYEGLLERSRRKHAQALKRRETAREQWEKWVCSPECTAVLTPTDVRDLVGILDEMVGKETTTPPGAEKKICDIEDRCQDAHHVVWRTIGLYSTYRDECISSDYTEMMELIVSGHIPGLIPQSEWETWDQEEIDNVYKQR